MIPQNSTRRPDHRGLDQPDHREIDRRKVVLDALKARNLRENPTPQQCENAGLYLGGGRGPLERKAQNDQELADAACELRRLGVLITCSAIAEQLGLEGALGRRSVAARVRRLAREGRLPFKVEPSKGRWDK